MKTISKTLGTLALAVLLPFTASAAMAAQAPEAITSATTITSTGKIASVGLVKQTTAPKTFKVAGRRGRGLAFGILAGVATAAILSGAARSHHYQSDYGYRRSNYSYRRHQRRCDRWSYRCECGIERACRKYYRNCE